MVEQSKVDARVWAVAAVLALVTGGASIGQSKSGTPGRQSRGGPIATALRNKSAPTR